MARVGRKNHLSLTCRIIKQVLCLIYCCHPQFSFFLFFNWQRDLSTEHEPCNSFQCGSTNVLFSSYIFAQSTKQVLNNLVLQMTQNHHILGLVLNHSYSWTQLSITAFKFMTLGAESTYKSTSYIFFVLNVKLLRFIFPNFSEDQGKYNLVAVLHRAEKA